MPPVAVHDAKLRLRLDRPARRAVTLPGGVEFSHVARDGWVEVVVPPFELWTMLAVEYE